MWLLSLLPSRGRGRPGRGHSTGAYFPPMANMAPLQISPPVPGASRRTQGNVPCPASGETGTEDDRGSLGRQGPKSSSGPLGPEPENNRPSGAENLALGSRSLRTAVLGGQVILAWPGVVGRRRVVPRQGAGDLPGATSAVALLVSIHVGYLSGERLETRKGKGAGFSCWPKYHWAS